MTDLSARTRVLHIVESYGGGVASAIEEYARSLPEMEHHLLRAVRIGTYSEGGTELLFASEGSLSRNPLTAVRQVRKVLKATDPNVVHSHSSFAGLYTRLAYFNRSRNAAPIIYTPHGFSFERRDQNKFQRLAYWLIEWLLSWNTDVIAGCSEREASLAMKFHARRPPLHVPNVAAGLSVSSQPRSGRTHKGGISLVGQGRLGPARDPGFFLKVIDELVALGVSFTASWVGSGDEEWEQLFRDKNVEVTGWKTRTETLSLVAAADVYLHTAAWDGFPMAVLEAQAVSTTAFVRRIAAFDGAPENIVFDTPSEMVKSIVRLQNPSAFKTQADAAWASYLAMNTRTVQRQQLLRAYG